MPHGHHAPRFSGRRFRGGRGGARTVVIEQLPEVVYCDGDIVEGMCIPRSDARGILPTFVTPDDAKRYIDEVDAAYARLDGSIQPSALAPDFKASWTVQFSAWRVFAVSAKATVGWLNTSAVMDQTDRFLEQLRGWQASFVKAGGTAPGPMPTPPGQGIPSSDPITPSNLTTLVLAVGGVAALFMFGPSLARAFK